MAVAFLLEHNGCVALGEDRHDRVKLAGIGSGPELSRDVIRVHGVNRVVIAGSVGPCFVFAIVSLLSALALLVAGAPFAGAGLGVEAPKVGFHDVDASALGSDTFILSVPRALILVKLGEINASGTSAGYVSNINVKVDGTS